MELLVQPKEFLYLGNCHWLGQQTHVYNSHGSAVIISVIHGVLRYVKISLSNIFGLCFEEAAIRVKWGKFGRSAKFRQ